MLILRQVSHTRLSTPASFLIRFIYWMTVPFSIHSDTSETKTVSPCSWATCPRSGSMLSSHKFDHICISLVRFYTAFISLMFRNPERWILTLTWLAYSSGRNPCRTFFIATATTKFPSLSVITHLPRNTSPNPPTYKGDASSWVMTLVKSDPEINISFLLVSEAFLRPSTSTYL